MSLFGDDDDLALPRGPRTNHKHTTSALFDDEPAHARTGSGGLFADDLEDNSPWSFPTPKKASARGNLVRNLLAADEVPESYVDAFDALVAGGDGVAGGVSVGAVRRVLQSAGLDEGAKGRVLEVTGLSGRAEGDVVERGEFNVLLALIGLAQEGEDVTLDGVDDRRRKLPEPKLSIPSMAKQTQSVPERQASTGAQAPPASSTPRNEPTATPPRNTSMRKQSFGFDADPWGSPDLHRGHNHMASAPQANGFTAPNPPAPAARTTSNFTTSSAPTGPPPPTNDSNHIGGPPSSAGGEGGGWGSFNPPTTGGFSGSGLGGAGFGGPPGEEGGSNDPSGLGRSLGGSRVANNGVEEIVTVTTIPEKEGMFLFQHRNYQVTSARRNSKVIRRYSDFVWLLDCLHKRYPFRQLPLLPPKRVAINGNYIAADASFVEKRRKGLARFANALVRHPVLCQEQLVVMFLTVPTELAVWRKQATISVQEEFVGKALPPTLEDSLPPNLQELFDQVRSGVRRSAEIYINMCNLMERLAKRNEGIAADYARFSQALQALTTVSSDAYAVDTNDVPLLNDGLNATAKHLSASQALLEDEAKAWEEGVVEDLKRQRDCLVSMRDLFDRRDRLDKDNIPQLEKRIDANERKLAGIRAKPTEQQRLGEAEKVEEAIVRDKQSIVQQHARGVFIKECVRDELLYFQHSQYHTSKLHQDWSQERVKYAELQADNWRALSEEVEGMPLGE